MSNQAASRQVPDPAPLAEREARKLLSYSPAFGQIEPELQATLVKGMARITAYLARPEGYAANRLPGALAAVPPEAASTSFTDLLADVNFPEFVSSLLNGVFEAVLESSIRQMHAYADLVKSVSQTLDEFASDKVSDTNARDWLADSYADLFEREPLAGGLAVRPGVDRARALARLRLLPLHCHIERLDPADIEKMLVPAARRRLAAARQRIIASMVLMGINRIVVTGGKIHAS